MSTDKAFAAMLCSLRRLNSSAAVLPRASLAIPGALWLAILHWAISFEEARELWFRLGGGGHPELARWLKAWYFREEWPVMGGMASRACPFYRALSGGRWCVLYSSEGSVAEELIFTSAAPRQRLRIKLTCGPYLSTACYLPLSGLYKVTTLGGSGDWKILTIAPEHAPAEPKKL